GRLRGGRLGGRGRAGGAHADPPPAGRRARRAEAVPAGRAAALQRLVVLRAAPAPARPGRPAAAGVSARRRRGVRLPAAPGRRADGDRARAGGLARAVLPEARRLAPVLRPAEHAGADGGPRAAAPAAAGEGVPAPAGRPAVDDGLLPGGAGLRRGGGFLP